MPKTDRSYFGGLFELFRDMGNECGFYGYLEKRVIRNRSNYLWTVVYRLKNKYYSGKHRQISLDRRPASNIIFFGGIGFSILELFEAIRTIISPRLLTAEQEWKTNTNRESFAPR